MPLKILEPPKKSFQIVSDAIRSHLEPETAMMIGGTAAALPGAEVAAPHQVYHLDLQDVSSQGLKKAKEISWRYIVLRGDEAVAAAEVNTGKGMQFSHFNTGPFVKESVRAITLAENLDAVAEDDYEIRVLKIPAIYVIALWLHGEKKDLLIPMPPTNESLTPNKVYTPSEFFKILTPVAKKRLKFDDRPQSS